MNTDLSYEILSRPDGDFLVTIPVQDGDKRQVTAEIEGEDVQVTLGCGKSFRLPGMPLPHRYTALTKGLIFIAELNEEGVSSAYYAKLAQAELPAVSYA